MSFVDDVLADVSQLLMTLNTICPSCNAEIESEILHVDMPEFSGKLVHKTVCPSCHHSLVKTVSKDMVKDLGKRFELHLTADSDWKTRTIAKSRAATVSIPDIGLEGAAMDGLVMTVEELLVGIKEELKKSPSFGGDQAEGLLKLAEFMGNIDSLIEGELEAHLVMEDPEGMSFIESRGENDKYLVAEK